MLGLKSLTGKAAEVLKKSLKDLQAKEAKESKPTADVVQPCVQPQLRDMRCKTCGCGRFCGICGAQVWQTSPQIVLGEENEETQMQTVYPVVQMAQGPFMMMATESGSKTSIHTKPTNSI